MDSSPITAWGKAAAYFTFANSEVVILGILAVSVVLTVGVIGAIMRHEKRSEGQLLALEEAE